MEPVRKISGEQLLADMDRAQAARAAEAKRVNAAADARKGAGPSRQSAAEFRASGGILETVAMVARQSSDPKMSVEQAQLLQQSMQIVTNAYESSVRAWLG